MEVYPDAEIVEEGSAAGYDGASTPWCLVAFYHEIKHREFVLLRWV